MSQVRDLRAARDEAEADWAALVTAKKSFIASTSTTPVGTLIQAVVPATPKTTASRGTVQAATTTNARPPRTGAEKSDAPPPTLEKAPALAELPERAKYSGDALLPDLDELSEVICEAPNAAQVRSTTLAKFPSASAQQAKLPYLFSSA
ncbi:hypothetical protein PGT21_011148 [Puccinia graminis f. sp. tritici]|uniref:Uncharacterized protein n=1 Tax=Puccinia graminis f. sp. tritici TaxID=56615 RepID=A0A5B0NV77_PUCGR|nr:hypothetical protein PGT21_011148 [Puccinia graminis f. sp. tritici]KAA1093781.1 hypothetical protein PGTUg99_029253 [Puccinia graminis f. sp. tritici]